jgi:DNA mismatch endonuclease, patch repair protein
MGRVRNRDTDLERVVRSALHRRGLRFRKHVSGLPGRPDVVFPAAKVAVFIDGDFWHGYRFPLWNAATPPYPRSGNGRSRLTVSGMRGTSADCGGGGGLW